jgi:hypothetical protein
VRTFFPTLFLAVIAGFTLAGCTADLTEGCLAGKCPPPEKSIPEDAGCGPLPATGDIPCEVFKVIHEVCNHCHVDPPLVGAPFPLLTYEDTQMPFDTHGKLRYQRMKEVIQPDGSPHMPFASTVIIVPPLTDAQFATLDAWLTCPTPTAQGQGCECPGQGCTALPP